MAHSSLVLPYVMKVLYSAEQRPRKPQAWLLRNFFDVFSYPTGSWRSMSHVENLSLAFVRNLSRNKDTSNYEDHN